ncbi:MULTISPECIES: hypothetical protein [Pseudomonas]|uniref:Uncharacterized protein n=1 Tax=Pseudomonas azadiae TaxID=2843612 RepID=A0ABS6NWE7_9PSED|nr:MULTISPECIES: hypothetical protein [Pseudomonas]MBV4452545.1 hypothetical protein [Pseudomonas azadiae]NMF40828.1 hypothetical protein [Pseudomonas sp. SWRI 103]
MNKTEWQALKPKLKKYFAIIFMLGLAGLLTYGYLHKPELAPQIVLKQNFIPGEWLYIVEEARDRSEPKTLKFYMDYRESTDETMKVYLGKTPPFLVTDTDLKDVVIQRVANGLHIKLKGAVSRYHSDLYLRDGDTYTTYRISLEQVETRPPLPSGR